MKVDTTPLLFSLKPCYADLLFEGLKKAELRRRVITQIQNRNVFVYVTRPVMEMRGGFRVGQVWRDSPEEIWNMVSDLAKLDKRDFDAYFKGRSVAYALEIKDVWECSEPVSLNALRNQLQNFVVPQSWRYVKPEEYAVFREFIPRSVHGYRERKVRSANT